MEVDKIYNEDCLITMANMPEEFVDLVVTSPPYDNLRLYNGFTFDWQKVLSGLYRVVKRGGVVVWVVGDATVKGSETGTSFKQALYAKEIGFNLHDTMIYRKANPIPLTHNRYEQEFEYMFVFSKDKPNTFNPILRDCKTSGIVYNKARDREYDGHAMRHNTEREVVTKDKSIERNIWIYPVGTGSGKHPAPFPEQLAIDHVKSWSNEGNLVYDPFMGSGTTAKAAKSLNRHYIGSEISREYCDIISKRLEDMEPKVEFPPMFLV